MNKNLAAIRTLADNSRDTWTVEYGHDLMVPFFLIPDALDYRGYRNPLNFDEDAATAYMVAAAVNTAGPMAAALQQLADMAEAVPEGAPEAVQLFARAIRNAVESIPEVTPQPVKGPFEP